MYSGASFPPATTNTQRLLYIGITCGLSAPYVASQLHYLMTKAPVELDVTGVLLGFNPQDMARNIAVEVRGGRFKSLCAS